MKFIGNVELGKDVSVQQLQNAYSAVLVATGSSSDRTLIVPGEDAKGVMSACSFVNWYNGHPDFVSVGNSFDLSNVTDVVVVGNGNVAIDCARILTADVSTLEPTDITEAALKQLRKSSVKRVSVLARRGHGQSAFTIKELRELTKLSNVKVVLKKTEIEAGLTPETLQECKQSRPRKRLVDLIESLLPNESSCTEDPCRDINLRFLVSPVSVNVENNAACGVEVEVNQLVADPDGKSQACMVTDEPHEVIPGQLVIRSIGYKSEPIPELPFDSKRSVIPNDGGRVISESGECLPGLYVSGWVKRGPTGIIGSNIMDAKETTGAIVKDIHEGKLKSFLDQDATSEKKAQEGSGNMYFKQLYDHLNVVGMISIFLYMVLCLDMHIDTNAPMMMSND